MSSSYKTIPHFDRVSSDGVVWPIPTPTKQQQQQQLKLQHLRPPLHQQPGDFSPDNRVSSAWEAWGSLKLRLDRGEVIVLDGATGTEIERGAERDGRTDLIEVRSYRSGFI